MIKFSYTSTLCVYIIHVYTPQSQKKTNKDRTSIHYGPNWRISDPCNSKKQLTSTCVQRSQLIYIMGKPASFSFPSQFFSNKICCQTSFFPKSLSHQFFFSGSFSHSRLWDKCIHCLSRSFHAHRSRQCNCWRFQPERKGRWMALVGGTSSSFFGWLHTSLFKTGGEDL